jgi:hypothetical protein
MPSRWKKPPTKGVETDFRIVETNLRALLGRGTLSITIAEGGVEILRKGKRLGHGFDLFAAFNDALDRLTKGKE